MKGEVDLARLADGRWVCVCRNYGSKGLLMPMQIAFGDSAAKAWQPVKSMALYGQSPCLLTTEAGTLLLTYRETKPHENRGVGLSYSLDAGETWVEQAPIYRSSSSPDCAYPSMASLEDRRVLCVYYTEAVDDCCHLEGGLLEENVAG